jgi:hypothetical protein
LKNQTPPKIRRVPYCTSSCKKIWSIVYNPGFLGGKKKEKPRKKKKMLMLAQLNKGSRNSVRANLCQLSEERRKKRGASISACPSSIYCEEEEEADDVICYVPGSSIYSTGKEREREREEESAAVGGYCMRVYWIFHGPLSFLFAHVKPEESDPFQVLQHSTIRPRK